MNNEQSECKCGGMIFVNGHGKGVCRECGAETWPDERVDVKPLRDAFWAAFEAKFLGTVKSSDYAPFNRARGGMKL